MHLTTEEQKLRALFNKRLYGLVMRWSKTRAGRIRLKMYKAQNGRCSLCDGPLLDFSKGRPSLDHQIPQSLGGTWVQENLRMAHTNCNRMRGAGPLEPRGPYRPLRLEDRAEDGR